MKLNAFKCDRCGKLYQPYIDDNKTDGFATYFKSAITGLASVDDYYDLCSKCNAEFHDFFDNWIKGANQ